MDKYKNKYRIPSSRLYRWDYGWNAAYFVTLCTAGREHFFGSVKANEMELSNLGLAAWECWKEIPEHYPFVLLGDFVVMPNHVHGIIIIDKPSDGSLEFASHYVDLVMKGKPLNQYGVQSGNLGAIIRGYKIGVTKFARQHNIDFSWQARFHEHIIRDESSYYRITNYILNNPANWEKDKLYDNPSL